MNVCNTRNMIIQPFAISCSFRFDDCEGIVYTLHLCIKTTPSYACQHICV
jgi:hypothetical protein